MRIICAHCFKPLNLTELPNGSVEVRRVGQPIERPGNACPDCGVLLAYQESCLTCPSCGYTKCE